MKNSMKTLLFLSLLVSGLFADTKRHHVGFAESITEISTDTIKNKKLFEFSTRYEYMINNYLNFEARCNIQIGQKQRLDHTYSYGVFLKPNYPITTNFKLYGLLGYSKNKIVKNQKGFKNNETIQYGFSYGAGLEYQIEERTSIYVDYVRYINKSIIKPEGKYAIKIDTIGGGLKYNFNF